VAPWFEVASAPQAGIIVFHEYNRSNHRAVLHSDPVGWYRLRGSGCQPGFASSETKDELVFVTGSRILQRIKVSRVGTATYSPLRVIDREEIDRTGRLTTAGVLVNEPSLHVIGH